MLPLPRSGVNAAVPSVVHRAAPAAARTVPLDAHHVLLGVHLGWLAAVTTFNLLLKQRNESLHVRG